MSCKPYSIHLPCLICRKSMNNSELSITTSSEGGFDTRQTGTYSQYWDNSSKERFQAGAPFHDEYSSGGRIDVAHVEGTTGTEAQDTEATGRPPWAGIVRPDLGLWLLRRAGCRHDRWKRLSELLRSFVSARHCG